MHNLESRLPSRHLLSANGQDIIKSGGRQRKNRFLFQLPGLFMPKGCGRLGRIEQLNSSQPILYLDIDENRKLRFKGKVITSESSWMLLRVQSTSVHCKDVFERIIVFEDAVEMVDAEDQLIEIKDESNIYKEEELDFDYGLSDVARPKDKKKKAPVDQVPKPKRRRLLDDLNDDDNDDDDSILLDDNDSVPERRISSRPRRSTASKVGSYKEADEVPASTLDSESDDEPQLLLPAVAAAKTKKVQPAHKRAPPPPSEDLRKRKSQDNDSFDEHGDDDNDEASESMNDDDDEDWAA